GEIRTPDPRNRNPMLYPAELRAQARLDYQTWRHWASRRLGGTEPGRRISGTNFAPIGALKGLPTPCKARGLPPAGGLLRHFRVRPVCTFPEPSCVLRLSPF